MKALITGASSGIGLDMARYLSTKGYELILVSRNKEKLEQIQEHLPTKVTIIVADLSNEQRVKDLYVLAKKENIDILKENGRVYFIDRPLELLISTDDRPLSSNRDDLEKRYKERYSFYKNSADVIVDGSGTADEVAERIEADFIEYSCN